MAGTERTPDTPDALDPGLVDDFVTTGRDTLERLEGELVALERAPASDSAMAAALRVGQDPVMAGKRLVVVLASYGERYLSTPMFSAASQLPAWRDGQL